jgi:hypothetical protein
MPQYRSADGGYVIDHLVYATGDVAQTVDELNDRLGVTLTAGGRHVGLGTRNFLADLGDDRYLEVIGPDPEQPAPEQPRPFGIDELAAPRLVTWAARVADLDAAVHRARAAGYDPGPIVSMSRDRGGGVRLRWRMTMSPVGGDLDGLVPLLIDWADATHPSHGAASGLRLVSLTGFHPDPARIRRCLAALDEDLDLRERPEPALQAVLATPRGETVLR